ncbi:unnamed protein product [Rotaria sordida]|uniref:Uncharacterized protein n=1 Tax=Rotaria sordida TaxID=392033 RepID=A0A814SRK0_9BILA|nr:unnamed protein product [Rotaria sordida]CAF1027021.1 unnamed protein product [Rotaria sordida]CAF1151860.1 unnamed protein product [Rotaria sordida]
MLEIRLYELYDYVTLFLIVESNLTLSGKPKPLYLKENWSRFARYHNKIRRVEMDLMNSINKTIDAWYNERTMRNEGIRLALPNSKKDFLLLTSDLDEIPKFRFIQALASCQLPTPFQSLLLQCDFYYYSFEFRHAPNPYFPGVTVSRLSPNDKIPLNLRESRFQNRPMLSTCFHCSYCFDRLETVRLKIASFSHTDLDIPKYHDQKHIIDCVRNGKDLYDRHNEQYRRVNINETELPRLVQVEQERFVYMLDRSSPNAGFRDV